MSDNKPMTGYPSIDKPWLKYYSKEAINAPLPECTIYEYLYENNKAYPDDVAIIYFGKKTSYRELFQKIDQCANALTALGVHKNDIVTIALPSIPEALYLVYALNKIGAVANMIHPLAGKQELLNYLNEVESKVAFLFDGTYQIIKDVIQETSVECAVVVTAGESLPLGLKQLFFLKNKRIEYHSALFRTWRSFVRCGNNTKVQPVKKDAHSLALISHTGGTTGEPKGVMCSDYNLNALIWQIGCNLPHGRQEKYLVVLPPFINYSLVNAMLEPLAFGFTVVLLPKYEPDKFDDYIRKYRPNHISSIPAYWEALLHNETLKTMDLSCLNHIYYGGEAMNPGKEEAVNALLLSRGARNPLCKGLGATEMMSAATVTYNDCNMTGCVGIPLVKVNCSIVDTETGRELHSGEIGEICFTGPTVMMGYYHSTDATNEIIKTKQDGVRWLHTGDLGYINDDGILFVTGRIKRIIMTKGKDQQVTKLFPDRIENVISAHPAVRVCCVIGVPDEQRIHYAKAVVELNSSYAPSDKLAADLCTFCQGKLPEYQIPDVIAFMDALPRTDRGKVDYRALENDSLAK